MPISVHRITKRKITSSGFRVDKLRFRKRINNKKDKSGAALYEVDLAGSHQPLKAVQQTQRLTMGEKAINPTHKRKASSEGARDDAKRVDLGMRNAQEDEISSQDISSQNPLDLGREYNMLVDSFDKLFVSEEGKEIGMKTRKDAELKKQAALERIASTNRVLETTELLEKILSYLSPGNILTVLSVCKMWKACYAGSKTQLQAKTFFRPSGVHYPIPNSNLVYSQVNALVSKSWGPTPNWRFPGVPAGQTYVQLLLPQGVANMDMLLICRDKRFSGHSEIRIVFDKDETWRIKHIGSWRHLVAVDPPCPILITVECIDDEVSPAGFTRRKVRAYVPVRRCPLGRVVAIAQGLNAFLVTKYFRKASSGMFELDPTRVSNYHRTCTTEPARWEVTKTMVVKKRLG
ncbi:---NA--- [Lecanosticta acicola]|uniref:---NA n=1 Tax=Lecanosticta acicola TaxID=111012 RepID=A0AAI8Z5M8_9PEZI|nr:---NA--- [Lecanosticta acicola]